MKLYASTESERAKKGQGGNTFIRTVYTVEHDDKGREEIARTLLTREGDEFVVEHIPVQGDATVYRVPIRKV